MPFALTVPEPWGTRGWKVKIRDRERLEPPHVTIMKKTKAWRFGLRSAAFLDKEPDPDEVPAEVTAAICANLAQLGQEWDRMFPENPVASKSTRKKGSVAPKDE
jgi:hypothetical protein